MIKNVFNLFNGKKRSKQTLQIQECVLKCSSRFYLECRKRRYEIRLGLVVFSSKLATEWQSVPTEHRPDISFVVYTQSTWKSHIRAKQNVSLQQVS